MSLNIKNERVHELAREAAKLTGKSQTGAIEQALEELMHRLQADDEREVRRRRLGALFEEWRRNPLTEEEKAAMQRVEDGLYDPETGLPA
jgi:antitoxin VapB